jgi:hypothetical protein
MIPSRHFDHVVTIWGSHELRGPTFGDASRLWNMVPGQDQIRIAIQTKRETRSDQGPGERVIGEYKAFGPASLDVIEGDVIEIHSGPEASVNAEHPRLLKVDSAYKPRSHHTELVLIDWQGALA